MTQFVDIVNELCPLLKPYVEAHKREKEEQERKRCVACYYHLKAKGVPQHCNLNQFCLIVLLSMP